MKKEDEDDESSAAATATTLGRESRDVLLSSSSSSSSSPVVAAAASGSGSGDEEVSLATTSGLVVQQQEKKPKGLTSPRAANPLKHTDRTLLNLAVLMAKPPNGIVMKDRRYRLRLVRNCFQAVEAVEWLMNTLKYTREEAIYTCKELTISQYISHVADKKREFAEGQSLYNFSDQVKQLVQKQIDEIEREEQAAQQAKPAPLQDDHMEEEEMATPEPTTTVTLKAPSSRPSSTILSHPLPLNQSQVVDALLSDAATALPDSATPPSISSSPNDPTTNSSSMNVPHSHSTPALSSQPDLRSSKGLFSLFGSRKKIELQDSQEVTSPLIPTSLSTGALNTHTNNNAAAIPPPVQSRQSTAFMTMSTTLLNMFGHKSAQDLTFPISPDPKHLATPESLKKVLQKRARLKEKTKKKSNRSESEKNIKIVVFGAGECGKSTLLRQWRIFIRNDFTEDWQRIGFIPIVNEYVILIMESLLSVIEESCLRLSENAMRWAEQFWEHESPQGVICPEQTEAIRKLWSDETVQGAYHTICNENVYCLDYSTKYFLDAIERITSEDYVPSFEDMLRVRTSPTCISELDFNINNENWRIVDTGGSFLSQKSWIHTFNDVSCLIYVVDTSCVFEGDQNSKVEDDSEAANKAYFWMEDNLMYDSLRTFGELCSLRWFAKTPIILIFNKINILQERMLKEGVTAMKHFFTDYRGGDDWRAALSFIQQQFVVQNQSSRPLYCFYVNAILPEEAKIKQTFDSIQQAVLTHLSQDEG